MNAKTLMMSVACAAMGMGLFAAEAEKAKITIIADRADGLYGAKDKVEFCVKVTNPDGSPATNGTLWAGLRNWGGKQLASENFDLAKKATGDIAYRGTASVKATLGEPGFVCCTVHYTAPGQDVWSKDAVACDPRKIENGMPRPKDFDKFWDAAITNLDKTVPADVRCEKDPKTSTKTHTCFRLSCATAGENRRTYGFLAVPNEGVEGKAKFPVRLTVPGAGPGCYWPSPKDGVITLTMNVFDFEPGWNTHTDWKVHYERYHEMHKRWAAKFGTKEAWPAGFGSKVEDTFYYGAILGVNRLVNWLCAQPYVDLKDVTYSGQSQGGAFGIYLASLNTNLTAATISEPALTGLTMHKANRADGWPNPYACQTNAELKAVAEKVAPYLDGVNFTPRIKCRVRFGVGFIDQLCPPHCVYAAYNGLQPGVDRRMINGLGVGHGEPKGKYEAFAKRLEESWKKAKPIEWPREEFNPDHPELTDRVALPESVAAAFRIYVAPNGDDAAEGTIDKPLRTFEGARNRVRKLSNDGHTYWPVGAKVVYFREGVYEITNTVAFDKRDGSSYSGSPHVYRAYPGEKPVFTGGFEIKGSKKLTDAAKLARLPAAAAGKDVRVLDLKAAGFDDFTPQAAYGYRPIKPCWTVTDLYRDGKPLEVAVAPNAETRLEDCYKIGEVLDKDHDVFKADFPDMDKWALEKDVMAHGWWTFLWASTSIPVEKIDPVAKTVSVARKPNIFYYHACSNKVFVLENGLPALDRENEWVFDRAEGKAYVIEGDEVKVKGEGEQRKASDPVYTITRLAEPMVTVNDAKYLRFEGLTFEYGRTDAIVVSNAPSFLFLGNTVRNFGGRGLRVDAAKDVRVQNNDFHHFGFAALILCGGDRPSLTPGNNIIENNEISFTGRRQRTAPGSSTCQLYGCGNVLTHNFFHDTPGSALRLDGNEQRVSFNRFERCSVKSDDNGAIDMGIDITCIGNRFVFNEFYDIGYPNSHTGNGGIRLDDMFSQQFLYGNRFVRSSSGKFGAVQVNGGRDNVVENNWIEDCEWAYSSDGAAGGWWMRNMNLPYVMRHWNDEESIFDEPYISRYARTPDILRDSMTMRNFIRNNVVIGAKALKEKRTWKDESFTDNALFDKAPTAEELTKTKFRPIPPAGSAGTYKVDPPVENDAHKPVEFNLRAGIGRTIAKLERGEEVKVGFFGGSITAMAGWRNMFLEKLRKDFPKAKVVEVNASQGGAGSLAGAFRMKHDLLGAKCDLIVMEYATNDSGYGPRQNLRSMEGCVRQAWHDKPETDILFVYTMNEAQRAAYANGSISDTAYVHELIADHYGIPSVNWCVRLQKLLDANKWIYASSELRKEHGLDTRDKDFKAKWAKLVKEDGRKIFTFDNCHPTGDGHRLYGDMLNEAFDQLRARKDKPADHAAKMALPPLAADNMENAGLVFPNESIFSRGDWKVLPKDHPEMKKFGHATDRIWFTDKVGAKIRLRFRGRTLSLNNIRTPRSCSLKISIDGNLPFVRVLADGWSANTTLIWEEHIYDGSDSIHTVDIEVMRNPKHGGTELELAGLQLDGQLLDIVKDRVFFVGAHPDDSEGYAATASLLRDKYDVRVIDLTREDQGLGKPSVDNLAKLIRELRPVAIFTHWPVDTCCDHVQTAAVTRRAAQEAGFSGEYYFYEVPRAQTLNFRPLYSVDVSKTIADKKEKLAQAKARGEERRPKCAAAEVFTTYDGARVEKGLLENLDETTMIRH